MAQTHTCTKEMNTHVLYVQEHVVNTWKGNSPHVNIQAADTHTHRGQMHT